MKVRFLSPASLIPVLIAILGLALAGCKSTPKVDWNSRVGVFTYDQAVAELGPPDRVARLSDGKTVAEWVRRSHGGGFSFGLGTGVSTGNTGVGVGAGTSTGSRDKVLRLTFGSDNKLLSWSKINGGLD
jgi:hypothetical protein